MSWRSLMLLKCLTSTLLTLSMSSALLGSCYFCSDFAVFSCLWYRQVQEWPNHLTPSCPTSRPISTPHYHWQFWPTVQQATLTRDRRKLWDTVDSKSRDTWHFVDKRILCPIESKKLKLKTLSFGLLTVRMRGSSSSWQYDLHVVIFFSGNMTLRFSQKCTVEYSPGRLSQLLPSSAAVIADRRRTFLNMPFFTLFRLRLVFQSLMEKAAKWSEPLRAYHYVEHVQIINRPRKCWTDAMFH